MRSEHRPSRPGKDYYHPGQWSNQQLVEGDDYRHWQAEKHPNQGHHNNPDNY
jgi:hypothetical protein